MLVIPDAPEIDEITRCVDTGAYKIVRRRKMMTNYSKI